MQVFLESDFYIIGTICGK